MGEVFEVFRRTIVDLVWSIEFFIVDLVLSSCDHATAKMIEGPPPRFMQWWCKNQLYLVPQICIHLLFWWNYCQIVRRGCGTEEWLLSMHMLASRASHSQELVLKGQSDSHLVCVVRASKWSLFGHQEKGVISSVIFLTPFPLVFFSSPYWTRGEDLQRG